MFICIRLKTIAVVMGVLCAWLVWCVWDPALPFLYDSGLGKKAIIVGATSGMGRELALLLAADGYTVGCVGRRKQRLNVLKQELGEKCVARSIDVSKEYCMQQLEDLIAEMGGCDLAVISVLSFPEHAPCSQNVGNLGREYQKELYEFSVDLMGFGGARELFLNTLKKLGRAILLVFLQWMSSEVLLKGIIYMLQAKLLWGVIFVPVTTNIIILVLLLSVRSLCQGTLILIAPETR